MKKPKVLQVAAIETTVQHLLYPLMERLRQEGYEVHVACSPGPRAPALDREGYRMHAVPIARRLLALSHFKALWMLFALMRKERFDVVHAHTPAAAALARIAAKLARVPHIFYTAHGFYFHDRMQPAPYRLILWVERWLGRCCTDQLFSQSREDVQTALRERIVLPERVHWIGNGVETQCFVQARADEALRRELGIQSDEKVIGFIGRLVREKGVVELMQALAQVRRVLPQTKLLVIGEALQSDRDSRAKTDIARLIRSLELKDAIVFTGHRDDIPQLLKCMHIFALPSHREGMPRSILEAMAAGLPVVVTDIRGCREEVVDGLTGRLVPVGDAAALGRALLELLQDPAKARRMGQEGQRRAIEQFDERLALDRQMHVYHQQMQRSS